MTNRGKYDVLCQVGFLDFRLFGRSGNDTALLHGVQTGQNFPPPVTHPEFYYGFFGVTAAWQFLISRHRTPIPFVIGWRCCRHCIEKGSFVAAILLLYSQERVAAAWLIFAAADATWFVLFVIAYFENA